MDQIDAEINKLYAARPYYAELKAGDFSAINNIAKMLTAIETAAYTGLDEACCHLTFQLILQYGSNMLWKMLNDPDMRLDAVKQVAQSYGFDTPSSMRKQGTLEKLCYARCSWMHNTTSFNYVMQRVHKLEHGALEFCIAIRQNVEDMKKVLALNPTPCECATKIAAALKTADCLRYLHAAGFAVKVNDLYAALDAQHQSLDCIRFLLEEGKLECPPIAVHIALRKPHLPALGYFHECKLINLTQLKKISITLQTAIWLNENGYDMHIVLRDIMHRVGYSDETLSIVRYILECIDPNTIQDIELTREDVILFEILRHRKTTKETVDKGIHELSRRGWLISQLQVQQ